MVAPALAARQHSRPAPAARAVAAPVAPNATLVDREDLSATIARLRVRPDAGVPAFEPGQYFAIGLEASGHLVQRPYSTSSPRGEDEVLEFLVRLVAGGALTTRLWQLDRGARIHLGRPKGLFTASGAESRRPVYVATGTGIAPLLSMLETRLVDQADGPVDRRPVVVHGASQVDDLAAGSRLRALARQGRIDYIPTVSRPADAANAGWRGAAGRVETILAGVWELYRVDPRRIVAYLCGNPGMLDAATVTLRLLGVPGDAIRCEAF